MSEKIEIKEWPDKSIYAAKRAHLSASDWLPDWFWGWGKDQSCVFEGTWWDMVCFARNVLASENTQLIAPEFHKPEWATKNYLGEEIPYTFTGEAVGDE